MANTWYLGKSSPTGHPQVSHRQVKPVISRKATIDSIVWTQTNANNLKAVSESTIIGFIYSLDTVKSEDIQTKPWKRPIELGEMKVVYSNEFDLE